MANNNNVVVTARHQNTTIGHALPALAAGRRVFLPGKGNVVAAYKNAKGFIRCQTAAGEVVLSSKTGVWVF